MLHFPFVACPCSPYPYIPMSGNRNAKKSSQKDPSAQVYSKE